MADSQRQHNDEIKLDVLISISASRDQSESRVHLHEYNKDN